jgi:tetratricopeptide (TPR) repeat protein
MSNTSYSCFLVSPFGDKSKQLGGGSIGHFELLRSSIKEIIESFPDANIKMKRADEIVDVGSVQETFIAALHRADIVVAELSATSNANIFYELGIRFALRRRVTIPIWQEGTELPADLKDVLGVIYNANNPLANRHAFHEFIRQRLFSSKTDSPVYRMLPELEVIDKAELDKLKQRVIELETTLKQTVLDDAVKVLLEEAEHLLKQDDSTSAVEKFKQAYERAPKNLQLAIRYGQVLSKLKNHDDAISVLKSAAQLSESSGNPLSTAYRELGMAYSRASKPQIALDWLQKAVALDPSDSDIHGIIGGVYKSKFDIEKAIESYERGFDADPKSTYCLLNVIALRLIKNQTGDRIRVKQLLSTADRLTNEGIHTEEVDHWSIFDRAHYLLFAEKPTQAIEQFEQALRMTKTIGELESARKNLDLFVQVGTILTGLEGVIKQFEDRARVLSP